MVPVLLLSVSVAFFNLLGFRFCLKIEKKGSSARLRSLLLNLSSRKHLLTVYISFMFKNIINFHYCLYELWQRWIDRKGKKQKDEQLETLEEIQTKYLARRRDSWEEKWKTKKTSFLYRLISFLFLFLLRARSAVFVSLSYDIENTLIGSHSYLHIFRIQHEWAWAPSRNTSWVGCSCERVGTNSQDLGSKWKGWLRFSHRPRRERKFR